MYFATFACLHRIIASVSYSTEIEQPLHSARVLGVTAVEKATGSDAKRKDKKKKDKKKKDKKGRRRSSNLAASNLLSL